MKIHSQSHVCPLCLDRIIKLGYPCSSLMEICVDLYSKSIPFTYQDDDQNERIFKIPLDFLEKKGFVISTEIEANWIQIIPNLSKSHHSNFERGLCWC